MFGNKPFTFDSLARIAFWVALAWGLLWLLAYLSDVLIPFAAALLIAYLMHPLVSLIEKHLKNRAAAVLLGLALVIALVASLAAFLLPLVIVEIRHMGKVLSDLVNNSDIAARAAGRLPPDLWQALKDYAAREEIRKFFQPENYLQIIEALVRKVLPGVWGIITGTASIFMAVVGLFVIGLYVVFLLLDFDDIAAGWKDLIPPQYRDSVLEFIGEFQLIMRRYFRGQTLVALIVGLLFSLGFWIVGLPLGILFGLFVGLLNLVPYLQLAALIPAAILAVAHAVETGMNLWLSLAMTGAVFVIVQTIQDTVIVPKIMGRVTGFNPAMILLSLSVWGKLLGFFGLLIALPLTFLLMAYYRRYLAALKVH
ncbi:MAG: AI-2E family transporter [Deltaproteobacteria bacterium]|nr:AI-2E family transporter [Deltaproteobacteria bacterium]